MISKNLPRNYRQLILKKKKSLTLRQITGVMSGEYTDPKLRRKVLSTLKAVLKENSSVQKELSKLQA